MVLGAGQTCRGEIIYGGILEGDPTLKLVTASRGLMSLTSFGAVSGRELTFQGTWIEAIVARMDSVDEDSWESALIIVVDMDDMVLIS